VKKIISFVVLIFIFSSSLASSKESGDICSVFYDLAHSIMTARQSEKTLPETMQILPKIKEEYKDGPFASDEFATLLKGFILEAYKKTVWTDEKMKKNVANNFANDAALACYEHLTDE
jgi:thioredoxin-related protein